MLNGFNCESNHFMGKNIIFDLIIRKVSEKNV